MDGWDWQDIHVYTGEWWLLLIGLLLLLLGLGAGYALGYGRGWEAEWEARWLNEPPPPPNVGGTYTE